jgi:hypothetical protein
MAEKEKDEKELNGVDEHDDKDKSAENKGPKGPTGGPGDPGVQTTGPGDKGEQGEPGIKDIDADSIIDAFLEENPDLVDLPVDEWPSEAIDMLKETFNSEHVDAPNGVLPEAEDAHGEPSGDEEPPKPPTTDIENPEQDFDIAGLAKLVEAGDKDGAWDMLQNMFGVSVPGNQAPTNALDRMNDGAGNSSNALAKLIGELKF